MLNVYALLLLVVLGVAVGFAWWRSKGAAKEALLRPEEVDDADATPISMDPTKEGFVLLGGGPCSISQKKLPLRGRLQVFVRNGSQYATWRQFPSEIRYEVRGPSGSVAMTPDLTLSISDSGETYEAYASEPADRMMGREFEVNWFFRLETLVQVPGRYAVRAHYLDFASNWLEIEVAA